MNTFNKNMDNSVAFYRINYLRKPSLETKDRATDNKFQGKLYS